VPRKGAPSKALECRQSPGREPGAVESESGREPLGPWLQEDRVGSWALPLAASLLLAA